MYSESDELELENPEYRLVEMIDDMEEVVGQLSVEPAHWGLAAIRLDAYERMYTMINILGGSRAGSIAPSQSEVEQAVAEPSGVQGLQATDKQLGDKGEAVIVARRDKIVAFLPNDPLAPLELVKTLTPTGRQITHAHAEDIAFQRLLQGYRDVPMMEWRKVLVRYKDPRALESVLSDCIACDDLEHLDTRLVERSQMLSRREDRQINDHFIDTLVRQIGAIKFGVDWNSRGDEAGGKAWKGQYYVNAFKKHPDFKALDPNDGPAYQKALKAFRRKHEKAVTSRNRLLEVYHTFGSGALIDPLWNVTDIYTRRSPQFFRVFESLRDFVATASLTNTNTPVKSVLSARHPQTSNALLNVAGFLGGQPVYDYVQDFLVNLPPRVASV
ncbi:hypothetical protein BV22DRAFT_1132316 [Leucogyrophana mollusca]|uniref:Uncharacterized protein n=1 Tax=Leucogyrophana mollusca TaxID=85980 RepID=A0ACB8B802_9AGAM|nr:hypothetical protein BV22DRAFT_1132316 [Leucogyrophana mollusca]